MPWAEVRTSRVAALLSVEENHNLSPMNLLRVLVLTFKCFVLYML